MTDKIIFVSTPSKRRNELDKMFAVWMRSVEKKYLTNINGQPVFLGVDWAKCSGMSRGDILDRNNNVIHVRFKAMDLGRNPNHTEK